MSTKIKPVCDEIEIKLAVDLFGLKISPAEFLELTDHG